MNNAAALGGLASMLVEFSGGPLDGRRQYVARVSHTLVLDGLRFDGQLVQLVYCRRRVLGVAVSTFDGVALFDFVVRRVVDGGPGPRGGGDGG